MLNDLKPAVLAFVAFVIFVVVGATVVLVVDGYGDGAATIGVVLAAVIPLLLGQAKIHKTQARTDAKVDTILNGGSSEAAANAVDRVVAVEVARHDDQLAQLAEAQPPAHTTAHAQQLADVEAQARKSRP